MLNYSTNKSRNSEFPKRHTYTDLFRVLAPEDRLQVAVVCKIGLQFF